MRHTILEFPGEPMVLRAADGTVTVSIPIRIKRYGGRRQVVVPQGISATLTGESAPTAIQIALARGHRWLRQVESGKAANLTEIAKQEKLDRSYVSRMVNLTTLAPDIVTAILDETLPENVSLFDLAVDTPLSWDEQRRRVEQAASKPRRAGNQPPTAQT
jgi:hypothetical protein